MLRNENPFVDGNLLKHAAHYLSPSDPMRQPQALTQLQQAHLPALLWLFDTRRYRAQGRSTLLGFVALKLAMQGERVVLDDFTIEMTNTGYNRSHQQHFVHLTMELAQRVFPRSIFRLDYPSRTLSYHGEHPV